LDFAFTLEEDCNTLRLGECSSVPAVWEVSIVANQRVPNQRMAEILDTVMPDRIIGVVARPGCEAERDVFGYFASRSLDMESQGNRSFDKP
jgi:hypothetical protein